MSERIKMIPAFQKLVGAEQNIREGNRFLSGAFNIHGMTHNEVHNPSQAIDVYYEGLEEVEIFREMNEKINNRQSAGSIVIFQAKQTIDTNNDIAV